MGSKSWMMVRWTGDAHATLSTSPLLDRDATIALVAKLFPNEDLTPLPDGYLATTNPPADEILAGCYADVTVVSAEEFALDDPQKLHENFIAPTGKTLVHIIHSVVDFSAFGYWVDGQLVRAISVSPEIGIVACNFGTPLDFETPFWSLKRMVDSDYPLPFHPLEFGEEALFNFLGYRLEGIVAPDAIEPFDFPLVRFKRS